MSDVTEQYNMMLKIISLIVTIVGVMMVGAPDIANADSKFNGLDFVGDMFKSNTYDTNQTEYDEKEDVREAAQMKQWDADAQMEANGTMPLCKEGQTPLSDWMNSLNESDVINGDYGIIKKTCMEPEEEIKGAIILFK